jgi:predicted Zn-dependent protease
VASAICAPAQDLASQAAAARDADDVPRAIELYRQGVKAKPDWPEGWWFLGLLYYESHSFNEGRQAFTEFTKLEEKAPAGWAYLGLCEFEAGEYESALTHLDRAIASGARPDPDVEQVLRFHHALLLTRGGFFDQARQELQPFVQRGIRDPVLIAGLGLNALEMRLVPQEAAAQRSLVEGAGQTVYSWIAGDSSQAEAGFRSLLAAFPSTPGIHYLYATYLLAVRPEAMNGELQRELEVNPANTRARAALALRLARAGDAAAALPLARKAVEERPDLAAAQYAYGVALTEAGTSHDAIEHLEAAVRLDPANLAHHTALATAYSEAGWYERARLERAESIRMARESRGPG